MKKNLVLSIKFISFIILISLLIWLLNGTLTVKYMYNHREPHTETFKGFYEMERNSIDVLVLGSSHAASGFNPQDFYDEAQLRTYNLASSAQPVWLSYYWLLEALKYQTPKVVVFDCYFLFVSSYDEGSTRKALDYMRLGQTKSAVIQMTLQLDDENKQSFINNLLPLFRYHSRWDNLNEFDFSWNTMDIPSMLKGFWFYTNVAYSQEGFQPLIEESSVNLENQFSPIGKEYFDKMVSLCEERGIKLVVVKTPSHLFTQEQHNQMRQYTEELSIPFLDFNSEYLYQETGFEFDGGDMDDIGVNFAHPNLSGARKLSRYLAKVIIDEKWASGQKDEQWESTKTINDHFYEEFLLRNTTDFNHYLDLLCGKGYTVFISVKDEASNSISYEINNKLNALGLQCDWTDAFRNSYTAIIEDGIVKYEKIDDELIQYNGSIRSGLVRVSLVSAGYECGNTSSIMIDEKEYSKNKRGMNIVVYSNERKVVIDSVSFDTHVQNISCIR